MEKDTKTELFIFKNLIWELVDVLFVTILARHNLGGTGRGLTLTNIGEQIEYLFSEMKTKYPKLWGDNDPLLPISIFHPLITRHTDGSGDSKLSDWIEKPSGSRSYQLKSGGRYKELNKELTQLSNAIGCIQKHIEEMQKLINENGSKP